MTTGKRLSRRLGVLITIATVAGCPAAAGAKEKLDSFTGSCSLQGTSAFTPPATNSQQPLSVHYSGTGKCTGTLNGRQISDAPVSVDNRAHDVDGSCMRAKTTTPGQGSITFGDGTTIRYTFEFDFTGTEGEITLHGERSGTARGHGSFLTPRTPPDVVLQCAGAGAKEAPLDITLTTESRLVSKRAGGSNAPPAGSGGKGKRLRLSVRPRSVETGRRTSFAFRVTRTNGRAVEDAIVRFAGKEAETGDNGTARIAATLRDAGNWGARATKRGAGAATTTVVARRRGGDGVKRGPSTFSGSCQFAGEAAFNPPLTNNPQPVAQAVDGRGTCNGTFVDRRGRSHTLSNSPVRFLAAGQGENASCAGGTATETGRLVFTWDDLKFKLSETRTGGNVLASLTGANGGSATATAGVSQSEDPVAILQKCGGPGLDKVRIDGQLTTTDSISG
jgi:hypothetical protein